MSESHMLAVSPSGAATRAAIMEAAERLFRTLGYQKTTVADIARDLRMSPANVYRFFPSKAAINEAIAARILAGLDEAVWAVARGADPPPDRIRALFRLLQEQTSALFFHERRMHDMVAAALEEHWPIIEAHIHTIDGAFAHVVAEGRALGLFACDDPEQAGRMLHCTCPLFTHPTLVQQCRAREDLAALAAGMAEFCLRALRPG
jgi:AcrR family transcriptional regulator